MASEHNQNEQLEEEEEEEDEGEQIEGWNDWQSDEEGTASACLCLFCESRFGSAELLFDHCSSDHSFDFRSIIRDASLDFYGSFKLVNYVRSQVAENKCWNCGATFRCNQDLQSHLHASISYEKNGKLLWEDDLYLQPYMGDDALLHSFSNDEDEEGYTTIVNKEELMRDMMNNGNLGQFAEDIETMLAIDDPEFDSLADVRTNEPCLKKITKPSEEGMANGTMVEEDLGAFHHERKDKQLKVSFANVSARVIKHVNEDYFGAYSSFGIHREMISDKVRTDAYRRAIVENTSLMNQAVVMDVGCGTGILSLFAAQAGASRVIAVEASAKMASIATQIAKDNGLLLEESQNGDQKQCSGVINIVQGMIEELDKSTRIQPHSIDVLVSEWMGYCLLYESMLESVLYARDRWLKPGGAILPDTATIFVAGFGKGGTSLPFWENVYGFDMSCIGKEVVEDAARIPIVDVLDAQDIVTKSVILQSFDLATMTPDEMDFTASCELALNEIDSTGKPVWCHGLILWFETGFTNRFCEESPVVMSTSPYSARTHWSQTILTFREPIAMVSEESISDFDADVGTESSPAARIKSRVSIARSSTHRSIDIAVETTGIGSDSRKRSWPAQIFCL